MAHPWFANDDRYHPMTAKDAVHALTRGGTIADAIRSRDGRVFVTVFFDPAQPATRIDRQTAEATLNRILDNLGLG